MVEISRAIEAAACGLFSNCKISTEFCAEGMQPWRRRMKMKRGSFVGRIPSFFPVSTMARANRGMRMKRWDMTRAARRRTVRSNPSRPCSMEERGENVCVCVCM